MRIPCVCVCGRVFVAVQEMAEAQMLKLGVCPYVEEEGEEPNLTEGEELNSSCTAGKLLMRMHVLLGKQHFIAHAVYLGLIQCRGRRKIIFNVQNIICICLPCKYLKTTKTLLYI